MTDRPNMREVSQMLAARIEQLAVALIEEQPKAKGYTEWRWGSKGSLAIAIAGEKRGQFFDHEHGAGGDAIDLICHFLRFSRKVAWLWAVDWLGRAPKLPSAALAAKAAPKPASDSWRPLWRESLSPESSPVERYFVSRGLTLLAGYPLRYHPACPRGTKRLPAMLALMTDPATGEPRGVHRTYLKPDGSGKADVSPTKMMLGNAGIVRLVSDEFVTGGLGIAEGIETAISIMCRTGWTPIWAAGSAGAIARLPVLPGIETLTIFADRDDKGAGLDAAHRCARRWYIGGREAVVRLPPDGTDWAEALERVV